MSASTRRNEEGKHIHINLLAVTVDTLTDTLNDLYQVKEQKTRH